MSAVGAVDSPAAVAAAAAAAAPAPAPAAAAQTAACQPVGFAYT